MRLKAFLLAALLVLPTASRVKAGGGPETAPKAKEKDKKIVVVSPESEVVVDDDGVFISGDDEGEMFADLHDFENLPEFGWFEGGGYIGVRPVEMTPDLRIHFGAPKEAGVFVGKVEKDSPAAKAGLQVADIVTTADGEKNRVDPRPRARDPAQEGGRDRQARAPARPNAENADRDGGRARRQGPCRRLRSRDAQVQVPPLAGASGSAGAPGRARSSGLAGSAGPAERSRKAPRRARRTHSEKLNQIPQPSSRAVG